MENILLKLNIDISVDSLKKINNSIEFLGIFNFSTSNDDQKELINVASNRIFFQDIFKLNSFEFEEFWQKIISILGVEGVNEILNKREVETNATILHNIVEIDNLEYFNLFLNKITQNLNQSQYFDLLESRDIVGNTPLMKFVDYSINYDDNYLDEYDGNNNEVLVCDEDGEIDNHAFDEVSSFDSSKSNENEDSDDNLEFTTIYPQDDNLEITTISPQDDKQTTLKGVILNRKKRFKLSSREIAAITGGGVFSRDSIRTEEKVEQKSEVFNNEDENDEYEDYNDDYEDEDYDSNDFNIKSKFDFFEAFCKITEDILTNDTEKKEILRIKNKANDTLLQISMKDASRNLKVFDYASNLYLKYFEKSEIREIITHEKIDNLKGYISSEKFSSIVKFLGEIFKDDKKKFLRYLKCRKDALTIFAKREVEVKSCQEYKENLDKLSKLLKNDFKFDSEKLLLIQSKCEIVKIEHHRSGIKPSSYNNLDFNLLKSIIG